MRGTSIILMIISIISQVTGFFRELVLSYFYGASIISDAYIIAITIPTVIFAFIGQAITTNFIPMYSKIENYEGEKKAKEFINELMSMLIVFTTIFIIIYFLFSSEILSIFANGFSEKNMKIAIKMLNWSIFGVISMVAFSLLSGYLQYKSRFNVQALSGIVMNTIIIFSIILSYYVNSITVLGVGILFGLIGQTIIIISPLRKEKYRFSFNFNFRSIHIQNFIKLSIPVILGIAVNEINIIVDRTIASKITEGGISIVNYSSKLNGFIYSIFVFSIITVMYPTLVRSVNEKNEKVFYKSLNSTIIAITLMVIPATIGLAIFNSEIINVLYGRGAFSKNDAELTSQLLKYYSYGIYAVSLRLVISKIFYSFSDTKTPMINGSFGLIINITLNIILSRYYGLKGLALATSISNIFTTILLIYSLRKIIKVNNLMISFISFIKIMICSIIMGFVLMFIFKELSKFINQSMSLFISIIIGAIVYFILISRAKIPYVQEILLDFKNKFTRGH